MIHQHVPRELLGRVSSLDWLLSTSLMPAAMITIGLLANAIGARETLLLAGLLAGTLTLLTIATIPRLRDPEHNPQESSANRPEHQPNPRNDAPTTSRADENPEARGPPDKGCEKHSLPESPHQP